MDYYFDIFMSGLKEVFTYSVPQPSITSQANIIIVAFTITHNRDHHFYNHDSHWSATGQLKDNPDLFLVGSSHDIIL